MPLGVKIRRAGDVDAHLRTPRPHRSAKNLAHIRIQRGIADDEVGILELALLLIHLHPKAAFVLVLRLIGRRDDDGWFGADRRRG